MPFAELCVLSVFADGGACCVHPVSVAGDLLRTTSPCKCSTRQCAEERTTARPDFCLPFLRRPPSCAGAEALFEGGDEGEGVGRDERPLRVFFPEGEAAFSDATSGDLWSKSCSLLLRALLRRRFGLVRESLVLELGCGLGLPSAFCVLAEARAVLGTDKDAAALALASRSLRLALEVRTRLAVAAGKPELGTCSPQRASGAEGAASPEETASCAARVLLQGLAATAAAGVPRPRPFPEEEVRLLPSRAAFAPLTWGDLQEAAEARRRLSLLGGEGGGAGRREALLVVASDVVFCRASALALAETLQDLAGDGQGLGPCAKNAALALALVAHETRHSWSWSREENRPLQEDIDSALGIFLQQFECIDSRSRRYAQQTPATESKDETRRGASLLKAALLQVEREGSACTRCFECLSGREMTDACLGEGATCLLAISSDSALLKALLLEEARPSECAFNLRCCEAERVALPPGETFLS